MFDCIGEMIGTFAHGFTYVGIPIQLLIHDPVDRERDILQHVNAVAPAFRKGMKGLAKSPIVGEVNWFWV
jgi:adenosylmethionine-8-amino-7-oxononanoate aminotransferase